MIRDDPGSEKLPFKYKEFKLGHNEKKICFRHKSVVGKGLLK